MDISGIRKLIRLIEGTDVTEVEVTEGDQTIRVSRQGSVATTTHITAPMMAPTVPAAPTIATPAEAPATSSANDAHIFKAPMGGTLYTASSPDSDPFVSAGCKVKKGDTLCIIEAMKLMNEIEAEYDGTVEEILVNNASAIEFGQPLFVITPA